mgnify:CR=1 FL=1
MTDAEESYIEVPLATLTEETLQAIMQDWVSRDGTDYGDVELTEEEKVAQLRAALKSGAAKIVYETTTESVRILPAEQIPG